MDKLELKDIAPYLPYELKFFYSRDALVEKNVWQLVGLERKNSYKLSDNFTVIGRNIEYKNNINLTLRLVKPILRPMSDLTKEITHNGETFIPLHRILEAYCFDLAKMDEEYILSFKESLIEVDMSYKTAQMLHEMHFDVNDLIGRGLAINLNEVDNGK